MDCGDHVVEVMTWDGQSFRDFFRFLLLKSACADLEGSLFNVLAKQLLWLVSLEIDNHFAGFAETTDILGNPVASTFDGMMGGMSVNMLGSI